MLYFYIILSAVVTLYLNVPFDLFSKSYGIFAVPLLFLGILLALLILHFGMLCLIISLVNPKKSVNPFVARFVRKYLDLTLPIFFKLARVDIHLTGEEKIPENKRVLLVSNHLDNFDPAVILGAFPQLELGFIGKKEIYTEMIFVSKAMHLLHGLPIDRENNREAVKTITAAANLIKEDTVSVGVFPEGYTSRNGNLQPFRNGAFKIALKAKAPIVVCVLKNTNIITKNMFRRKTDVYLDVLDVIETENSSLSTAEIGEKVHSLMEEGILKYN